jgi:hypothetical protein
MRATYLVLGVIGLSSAASCLHPRADADEGPAKPPAAAALRWWKGNTHTHTLNSDGDSSPGEVSHWYRDHGYDFLVLSDHNYYTVIDELGREFDRETRRERESAAQEKREPRLRSFLLIPGEEVTDKIDKAEIHVNGLGTLHVVGAQGGRSKNEVLQRNIDAIIAAGGVPSVNHPNFAWSLTPDDIAALKRLRHFEIFNGHPDVHCAGGGGSLSLDDLWDDLLSRDVRLFGVAVDDAHSFKSWGPRESNPGRGWIQVRAAELTREAIRAAFEAGDYYASTGVSLADVGRDGDVVRVKIAPEKGDDAKFTTFFIGARGRVLARQLELESSYTLQPGDVYVRARIVSSRGESAWTQPFFREPK